MTTSALPIRLFATLFLFWLLLTGAPTPSGVMVGLVVAAGIAWLFQGNLSYLSGYRLSVASFIATVGFIGYFLKALVRSNLDMARVVLSPALPIDPAIVKVRTGLTDPVARLLLANVITLTPGTLTVEMEGEWLFVHWVVARSTDPEIATREIVSGFERYLEKMYD